VMKDLTFREETMLQTEMKLEAQSIETVSTIIDRRPIPSMLHFDASSRPLKRKASDMEIQPEVSGYVPIVRDDRLILEESRSSDEESVFSVDDSIASFSHSQESPETVSAASASSYLKVAENEEQEVVVRTKDDIHTSHSSPVNATDIDPLTTEPLGKAKEPMNAIMDTRADSAASQPTDSSVTEENLLIRALQSSITVPDHPLTSPPKAPAAAFPTPKLSHITTRGDSSTETTEAQATSTLFLRPNHLRQPI